MLSHILDKTLRRSASGDGNEDMSGQPCQSNYFYRDLEKSFPDDAPQLIFTGLSFGIYLSTSIRYRVNNSFRATSNMSRAIL